MRNLKYYTKKKRRKRKTRRKALQDSRSHLKDLHRVCLENINPVTEPLVLISQIQRSGGSFLSQLFDGHPEIHAHPHELKTGHPKKHLWPELDLHANPEQWFEILFEDNVIRLHKDGYRKDPASNKTFPFIFLPALQKKIFLKYLSSFKPPTARDVFNAYMTSYFGAWLNNQNFYGPKKWITAFTPRLSMLDRNMQCFFDIYPDGRLISIAREPKNWFPSAFRHNAKIKRTKYLDIELALNQWKECAQAMIRNKNKYGDKVCIIRFEDLIGKLEPVVRYLAGFLDIEFNPILMQPTFNELPIEANTSFNPESPGIMISTLSRYKTLSQAELNTIEKETEDLYQQVLNYTISF
jgi:hypothetical protein